jgi:hypothetical protein
MTSAICTLFEGSYHYGVAALANSLHRSGFRGPLFAGYRGEPPPWAPNARDAADVAWPGAQALDVGEGLRLVLLPLTTEHHLTNHKAQFMLSLLDGPARANDALFYVDPDICVVAPWTYFDQWASCGVALCEDVNSPLPPNHPRRVGWRRHFGAAGVALEFRCLQYVNGGFVGVRREQRAFIATWQRLMDLMAQEIGSLAAAKVGAGQPFRSKGFADCFDCSDQDALNAAIEACDEPVSVIGQEAMGFKPGTALLPHALGAGKPWQRLFLREALRGVSPRLADRAFWANVSAPIEIHRPLQVSLKRAELAAASALGRFMRRSWA